MRKRRQSRNPSSVPSARSAEKSWRTATLWTISPVSSSARGRMIWSGGPGHCSNATCWTASPVLSAHWTVSSSPTIREQAEQFSGRPTATLVGGGRASIDQAAFFNTVLVRYPDLLDTYLTVGGLCHPADNFGALLAVAEHVDASGADFLLALAVAYEIQCRFSAQVPVMARGLNHALQLAMSVASGSAILLGLRRRADRQRHRGIRGRQRVPCRRAR